MSKSRCDVFFGEYFDIQFRQDQQPIVCKVFSSPYEMPAKLVVSIAFRLPHNSPSPICLIAKAKK